MSKNQGHGSPSPVNDILDQGIAELLLCLASLMYERDDEVCDSLRETRKSFYRSVMQKVEMASKTSDKSRQKDLLLESEKVSPRTIF